MEKIIEIGCHRLLHGDINNGINRLMGKEQADIFYSDPPWGEGNLKYWQTMNRKQNGAEARAVNLESFMDRVLDTATAFSKGPVIIEYGKRWYDWFVNKAEKRGLTHCGHTEALYRSGYRMRPLHVHLLTVRGCEGINLEEYFACIKGTSGFNTVQEATAPFRRTGAVILDPCCGKGLCARLAVESGMCFRGNELNAKRLEETKDWLRRKVAE